MFTSSHVTCMLITSIKNNDCITPETNLNEKGQQPKAIWSEGNSGVAPIKQPIMNDLFQPKVWMCRTLLTKLPQSPVFKPVLISFRNVLFHSEQYLQHSQSVQHVTNKSALGFLLGHVSLETTHTLVIRKPVVLVPDGASRYFDDLLQVCQYPWPSNAMASSPFCGQG